MASVRSTRAEGELRQAIVEQFISDERDAESLAWHRSMKREDEWVSTRDELEVWCLGCLCGADQAKVFGVRVGDVFSAPLFFACQSCASRSLIFDPTLHGYDAQTSKRKRRARKEPQATFAMLCRACKTTLWRPAVIVTYQGEPSLVGSGKSLQDLFDVILVGGECASCGAFALPFDAECA